MTLTKKQSEMLSQWDRCDIGMGFHFRGVQELTGKSREEIAPIVRELAAYGYLEFMRGCTTEDGEFSGSAYVLTEAGSHYLHTPTLPAGRTTEGGEA